MLPPFIIFIIVLSIVVLIHELGHFLAAKLFGMRVDEFGFGYPPRLIGKKIGETIYSINWLPFGGFVKIYGEQEADEPGSKSNRAFFNKSKKQRAAVILAGVVMNLLLAVVCFSAIYSIAGIPEKVDYISVETISKDSPAEKAGLQVGDVILDIDGQKVTEVSNFVDYVKEKAGSNIAITIKRDNQVQNITLVPRQNPPEGEGAVGVAVSNYDNIFYPVWQMPFRGALVGIEEAYGWTKMMVVGLGTMISEAFRGVRPQVTGVVGIYQVTTSVAEQGILPLIKFIGILSINLAVVNVLPFPALDGGRFMFIVFEKVIGRKMRPKIEAYINMAGFAILVTLMILITIGDVMRLLRG
jgi:regulator of sigma E protease